MLCIYADYRCILTRIPRSLDVRNTCEILATCFIDGVENSIQFENECILFKNVLTLYASLFIFIYICACIYIYTEPEHIFLNPTIILHIYVIFYRSFVLFSRQ